MVKNLEILIKTNYQGAVGDDERARQRLEQIFKDVKINKQVGLFELYRALIHANGVLGGKYDAPKVYAKTRELLEKYFDKEYLGLLSVNESPTYRDKMAVEKEIVVPAVKENMKAQGIKAPTINKFVRNMIHNDWFYDLDVFIAMYALLDPKLFVDNKAFLEGLKSKINGYYVGIMPDELTLDFFKIVQKNVLEKVVNKNFN